MSNSATISRSQLIYGLCLPLAALIGFFLAEPLRFGTWAVLGLMASVVVWPLFSRWYHPLLIGSFHCAFVLGFLQGSPPLWFPLAFGAFVVVIFNRCLSAEVRLMPPGGVAWSLIGIAVVVVGTAFSRGGIGVKALGSASMGGKNYIYLLLAVMAYFALVSRSVPPKQALIYMGLFCLSGLTSLLSHLVYLAGGKFYWLYNFIDSDLAMGQAAMDWDVQGLSVFRSGAMVHGASAIIGFMLAWFGMGGLLNLRKPWRILIVMLCLTFGLFGGFRSFLLGVLLLLGTAFFLEGLHRTRHLVFVLTVGLVCFAGVLVFSDKLPPSVQRSLSFLPITVDAHIKDDAQGSLEWRYQMWDLLEREIPQYLALGKGYAIDPAALQASYFNAHYGFGIQAEWAVLAGQYHNGPLSVLIPFGIWGALAFGWFLCASLLRLRWLNRNGNPELYNINRVLLAIFIGKIIFFVFFFGSFFSELIDFVSVMGVAECLNGELRQPAPEEELLPVQGAFAEEGEV